MNAAQEYMLNGLKTATIIVLLAGCTPALRNATIADPAYRGTVDRIDVLPGDYTWNADNGASLADDFTQLGLPSSMIHKDNPGDRYQLYIYNESQIGQGYRSASEALEMNRVGLAVLNITNPIGALTGDNADTTIQRTYFGYYERSVLIAVMIDTNNEDREIWRAKIVPSLSSPLTAELILKLLSSDNLISKSATSKTTQDNSGDLR